MQAKDIADASFLEVVRQFNDGDLIEADFGGKQWYEPDGWGRRAFVWDVADILGVPGRLAEAKARKLIRRGMMTGCDAMHWCRGDYEITECGRDLLEKELTNAQR